MKIFIGEENSCNLNYQHNYIYGSLLKIFELTNKVDEADIIIIAETCCCTQYHIQETIDYISSIIEKKKGSSKIYLTGCITRKFKEDPFLAQVEEWLKENVDFIIPQNQPNLLLKLISQNEYGDRDINNFGMLDVYSKDYIVVTFLSILDLARKQELKIVQEGNFDQIMIMSKEGE